ncbi:MAG: hypothetical protein QXK06_05780 [Candidatus Diapherotrites archaeon]
MPSHKMNPKKWNARQLQRQPKEHVSKGIEGLATMAVKRYMGERLNNCHQMARAHHIVEFVKTNPQIDPYLAIRNFSRRLVENHVLIEAAQKLGLDFEKAMEEIKKGKKGK